MIDDEWRAVRLVGEDFSEIGRYPSRQAAQNAVAEDARRNSRELVWDVQVDSTTMVADDCTYFVVPAATHRVPSR